MEESAKVLSVLGLVKKMPVEHQDWFIEQISIACSNNMNKDPGLRAKQPELWDDIKHYVGQQSALSWQV